MKIFVYYEITKNTDSIEGRGIQVDTGICFESEEEAVNFCKYIWFKCDYYDYVKKNKTIYSDLEECINALNN